MIDMTNQLASSSAPFFVGFRNSIRLKSNRNDSVTLKIKGMNDKLSEFIIHTPKLNAIQSLRFSSIR